MAPLVRRTSFSPAISAVVLAVLILIGYPLATLLAQSVVSDGRIDGHAYARLFQGTTAVAIEHTLLVAAVATAASTAIGVAATLLVQRSDLPARRPLAVLLLLPLLTPPFVQSVAWLEAYARGGLTSHWWGYSVDWLRGSAGIMLLLTLQGYPVVYLLAGAFAVSQRGAELEEAARAAGGGQWRAFRDVTLPLLVPGILAAALIAFVSAASDFGVPAVLGIPAGYTVVTTLIYRQLSFAGGAGALGDATALSGLLAIVALFALIVAARLTPATRGTPATMRRGAEAAIFRLHAWRWPAAAILYLFLIAGAVFPLLALVLQALEHGFVPSLVPASWTIEHFQSALGHGGLQALTASAGLAALSGAIVAGGGAVVAATARRGGAVLRGIEALTALPFALPGSTIAVAVILAWQRWLYGTFAIILLAYIPRFAIFGVRSASAAFSSIPAELAQAGRGSGARSWRVAWDIQRPLLQPAALAAFALVFLLAVHELTISSLLYTPQTQTIAVKVLNAQQAGDVAVTAALAVIITAITFAVALPLAFSRHVRRLLGAELAG